MIRALIILYLGGLMVFYTKAAFSLDSHNLWNWSYYWWDKSAGAGFLMWYCLARYCKAYKAQLALVYFFSVIRFVWDIISYFTDISVNNQWVVAALFLVLISVIGVLCFHPDRKIVKLLEKHLL